MVSTFPVGNELVNCLGIAPKDYWNKHLRYSLRLEADPQQNYP